MTISSTVRVAGPYSGNDATVTFSFAFKVFEAADVQVILTDSTDTESILTLTTDYTVTLNGNQDTNPGGSVTLLVAPATGEKLTVTSDQASYQSVSLANQGGFYPEVINNQLDKLAINIQQCERDIAQAARVPLSSTIDPDIVSDALITVATSIGDVETVAWSIGDVGTVATNIANVNLVGVDIANVNSVAGDLANIDAVAGDLSNVDIVADDIADVSTCADNIALIQSAPTNAASASSYASLALAANEAAEAAASASGDVLFYDTKSAANTALSGLSNGQIVEIMADESVSGLRTRYRVDAGAYVFKLVIGEPKISTVSALRAIPYSALLTTAQTLGRASAGDGGGGLWRWDATVLAATPDNTGTIVKPTGHTGDGAWVRVYDGPIVSNWFSSIDDASAACIANSKTLLITGSQTATNVIACPVSTTLGQAVVTAGGGSFPSSMPVETNVVVGSNSLTSVQAWNPAAPYLSANNVAVGNQCQKSVVDGHSNVSVGNKSLRLNVSGDQNTAVGYSALETTTSSGNTAVGTSSLKDLTTGSNNTAIGRAAGLALLDGTMNTLVGRDAGNAFKSGDYNTIVGADANYGPVSIPVNYTITKNTLVGYAAGKELDNNSTDCVAVGYQSGYYGSSKNVAVGSGAQVNKTSNTVAVGYNCLTTNTAANLTAVGFEAGLSNTSGAGNTYLGYRAGRLNKTGANNVLIGYDAGGALGFNGATAAWNTVVGASSLTALQTGSNNTVIGGYSGINADNSSDNIILGRNAGNNASLTLSRSTLIGTGLNFGSSTVADTLWICTGSSPRIKFDGTGGMFLHGASIAVQPYTDNSTTSGSASYRWKELFSANGTINTSDARLKQQVTDLDEAERLAAVACKRLLKKFKFNDSVEEKGESARWHFGVLAQDVAAAFAASGLNATDYALFCYDEWDSSEAIYDEDGSVAVPARAAGNRYGIRYDQLFAFIISAL